MPEMYHTFCDLIRTNKMEWTVVDKHSVPIPVREVVEAYFERNNQNVIKWELGFPEFPDAVCLRLPNLKAFRYIMIKLDTRQHYSVTADLKDRLHPDVGNVAMLEESFPEFKDQIKILPDRTFVLAALNMVIKDEMVGDVRYQTTYRDGKIINLKTTILAPEVAECERNMRAQTIAAAEQEAQRVKNKAKRSRRIRSS